MAMAELNFGIKECKKCEYFFEVFGVFFKTLERRTPEHIKSRSEANYREVRGEGKRGHGRGLPA